MAYKVTVHKHVHATICVLMITLLVFTGWLWLATLAIIILATIPTYSVSLKVYDNDAIVYTLHYAAVVDKTRNDTILFARSLLAHAQHQLP